MEATNIISVIFNTAMRRGDAVCARYKRGDTWVIMTWAELAQAIKATAAGLRVFGVRHGDRVAICAPTSIEWTIADCAIMAAGGVTVPIYTSLLPEKMVSIIKDSSPVALLVDQLSSTNNVIQAINISGPTQIPLISLRSQEKGAYTLSSLSFKTSPEDREEIEALVSDLHAGDTATIVYTSGTMGEQKGVVLTHGNIFSEICGARKSLCFCDNDVGLHCLPLAHVLGRLMQFYTLAQGCESAYAEGIEKLANNYLELKPSFVCGVPRMLEKIHELVFLRMKQSGFLKRSIFDWGMKIGSERSSLIQKHRAVSIWLAVRARLADLLVFRHIRVALGGKLRCFICGGAPLSEEIAKFFHAAGIFVLEGWGLTETFAAATVNRLDDFHFGTVGKAIPGAQLKITDDGEILVKGPTVFKEYLNMPKATHDAFDEEGWFKTGDLGEYSRDGFLRITGRKKDIIITAGGKNIAPQMVEMLMAASPYINHFMVYGDRRKFLVGLVVLNKQVVRDWLVRQGHNIEGEQLSSHPVVCDLINEHIREQNRKLASYESIKKFIIVDNDFSVATGELTPTLKIRRGVVSSKFKDLLDILYEDD